ncbi:hypothetical protein C2845_PM03G07160 [Panicum miliaceum]|uniref:F-box/FBD/LRR-repeat protein n=1 Tax=Panicum miliaceum TaxID=4540 RepID=A0A3L6T687_PANMI|nr:hypothetical protein C2845_PM03G07160 [Panicum miliaceum]
MAQANQNQGSCTRCHRDLPGCSSGGGGHNRRSARLCCGRDPGGADRISALHDDLLLQILAPLGSTHTAARTDLLSRRWRGLWTRLPELVIRGVTPRSLHAALARLVAAFEFDPRARPQLLDVCARWHCSFSLAQIASLFRAAARLQPEHLAVFVAVKATAPFPVTVMLPRLVGTRSLTLDVRGVNLVTPLEGDMPDLESLLLLSYDAVLATLLHRCSALRSLSISYFRFDSITIDLPLLEELVLSATTELRRVVIIAPRLKKLAIEARAGVADDYSSLFYMGPEVEDLSWQCTNRASRVRFGDIWSLRNVTIKNSEPQGQLQQSPPSHNLSLSIWEGQMEAPAQQAELSRGSRSTEETEQMYAAQLWKPDMFQLARWEPSTRQLQGLVKRQVLLHADWVDRGSEASPLSKRGLRGAAEEGPDPEPQHSRCKKRAPTVAGLVNLQSLILGGRHVLELTAVFWQRVPRRGKSSRRSHCRAGPWATCTASGRSINLGKNRRRGKGRSE